MYHMKVNNDTSRWEVHETDTEQCVKTCDTENKARELTRSLNLGAGFQGFTPTFMTIEYK